MVKKDIVDWVILEKSKGFSDEQVKQTLTEQGYNINDISEIFSNINKSVDNESFSEFLSKKGKFFKFLIYFSLSLFFTSILFFIYIITIPYFSGLLDSILYIPSLIYIFFAGFIIAYISNKICNESNILLAHAIIFSCILSLIISVNSLFLNSAKILSSSFMKIGSLNNNSTETIGSITSFINTNIININLFFILSFIFFNIFFLFYYFKRDKKNYFFLFFFIIPLIIFFFFSYFFNILSPMVSELFLNIISKIIV